MADYVAKERLFLTADKERVVKEGDPDAAYVLVGEGGVVNEADAKKYGLSGGAKAADEPEGTKAVTEAPSNKAVEPKGKK